MTRLQLRWAASLAVALTLPAAVRAEDPWWIVKPHPPAAAAPSAPHAPAASLGRPVPVAAPQSTVWSEPTNDAAPEWDSPTLSPGSPVRGLMPAGYDDNPGGFLPPRVVRGQPPDPGALSGPPPVPPPDAGAYNAGAAVDQPLQRHPFLDGCKNLFDYNSHPSTNNGAWFKSDCFCEESMISPVTNPFFFTDPRALTQIEPLFMLQTASHNGNGGNAEFYGIQGSVALSERFSLVLNKLGFVSLNPKTPIDGQDSATGFADVYLGPKFTFWRDESLRNAAAVGLTLELPVGSDRVFQDTGTLGLDPYISYGQSFGDSSFGSFNFMGEAGYSFSVDDQRSEFIHLSGHLDYDVLRNHHWYPLLEMNYFYLTKRGDDRDLNFEGFDLVNFGARQPSSRSLLTIAPGLRYRFNEWASIGTAVEFPLVGGDRFETFRWTLDLIFRY
ncbi:MAG TPA: transporter [Gemmataceae bacterium]|nr:transporter [Gemmataceae bacterium]